MKNILFIIVAFLIIKPLHASNSEIILERNISVADFMNNWDTYNFGATIGSINPRIEETKRIIVSMYISDLYSPGNESSGFIFGMSVNAAELGVFLGHSYAVEFNKKCWNPFTCGPKFEESIHFKKRVIHFAKKNQEISGFSHFNSWKEQDLNIKIKIEFVNDVKATNIVDLQLPGITLTKADLGILPPEFVMANYLKDLINEEDETAYSGYDYIGKNWIDTDEIINSDGNNSIINREFYQYRIHFIDDTSKIISILKTDFSKENSINMALFFGNMLGRLPLFNRSKVNNLHILKYDIVRAWYYSDSTDAITIITDASHDIEIYEELLLHETGHIALDSHLYNDDWFSAEYLDNKFISQYAASIYSIDNPPFNREDHAESYLAWIASRFRSNRFNSDKIQFIENQIPNRLSFYDSNIPQGNLYPIIGIPNNKRVSSYVIDSLPINEVKLYPNPSKGSVFLEFGITKDNSSVTIEIINLNGQVLLTKKISNLAKKNNHKIQLNENHITLESGIYFVNIYSDEFSKMFKLIIK
tara:strand:- start:121 stop:1713 length:1593 start_codon:yes stop_codon:yes gene_type:complete